MQRAVVLASTSPRRRQMLREAGERAGFALVVADPKVDDGELMPGGVEARSWVMSVAFLKAQAVARRLRGPDADAQAAAELGLGPEAARSALVVGADTMVVDDDRMIGKPADAPAARATLTQLGVAAAPSEDPSLWACHEVWTGVAIIDLASRHRELFAERTLVRLGGIGPVALEAYIAGGGWRGKAGGYNLPEVRAMGWPVRTEGDADNVAGLPMAALLRRLTLRGAGGLGGAGGGGAAGRGAGEVA